MKKYICIILCIIMLFLLASCGSTGTDTPAPESHSSELDPNTNEEGAEQPESSAAESSGPDLEALAGHYTLCNYYNPDPYASYLYPELRSLQDETGEAIGSLDLNADGTGTATYPGGSLNLTWDDSQIYLNGEPLSFWHRQYQVRFELESGETLLYSKLSEEEAYAYEVDLNPKQDVVLPSDYTVGDVIVERYTSESHDYVMPIVPITNNSDRTLVLDMLYYSVSSPSGDEIGYRLMTAYITPVLLPGETGFFYEHTVAENIPEDAVLESDMVFIFEWLGDYQRFEIKGFTPDIQDYGDCWIHRPTGTVVIPEGIDPSTVKLVVACYGPDGRLIGIGGAVNTSRDVNPKNYFEVPENGGDAPFLVNMSGPYADRSFDQNLIDHYEVMAFSPSYYAY